MEHCKIEFESTEGNDGGKVLFSIESLILSANKPFTQFSVFINSNYIFK